MKDRHFSILSRLFTFVAGLLMIVAAIDWILRLFGWTFEWLAYQPGRLFELAAILMVFVIAFLLRQIREALRNK